VQIFRRIALIGGGWLLLGSGLFGAQNAFIVIGTTGNSTVANDLAHVAQDIRDSLVRRGFAAKDIEILGPPSAETKVTLERVQQGLQARQNLAAKDEFWLVLLGFSGRDGEGKPTFQVSGPRLSVADLKTGLDAIPARQYVFVGTSDSGGYVAPLLKASRNILSATREEGEIDLPRFPEQWAAALKEKPKAGWKEIAARAAELTSQEYDSSHLVSGEHARLGDPETGKLLEAPFGVDKVAAPVEKAASDGSMALIDAADIKVEIHKPNDEWEKQPATAETKKLIETARNTPNPDGFSSLLLEQRLGYKVGEDRSAEDFVLMRIYIASEDGVARWANFSLPQDPPAVTTKLEAARIIQPDGSSTVFNPAKMPVAKDPSTSVENSLTTIFMPDTHAGCLIEIAYRIRHLLDTTMPAFSEELPVQRDIPVLATELQLQVPDGNHVHYKLRNSDQKAEEAVANGIRTLSWKLGALPAFEPLPNDPPERDYLITLDISSLDSWNDFVAWYRRLARGSDLQDDTVKAKAKELAAGVSDRTAKIRKAYEFVSALRYVAIEYGINGLRPRTPALVLQNRYGDCKDKANLLVALLADMGIEGRFCVLNRGSTTDVNFPSWQFNHAIAYVPKAPEAGQAEDLWLDTTDSTAPFPTLAPGDIGRQALVFDHETAQFLPVKSLGKEMTAIEERWQLRQQADGTWKGALQDSWSGLAEYMVRSKVRGRSPRQRDYILQSQLAGQLDNADFTGLKLSPADDLSIPMKMDAQVIVPSAPLPRSAFELDEYFAPPERNRPLLINNGQKFHLTQTVELTYAQGEPTTVPASFQGEAAGVRAKVTWERLANHAWRRTAELEINEPLIASADYAAARHLLRDWTDHLAH